MALNLQKHLIFYELMDFIKENNIKDKKYFENININKIITINKFFSSKYERIQKYLQYLKCNNSFILIYEIILDKNFNEYNLLKIIEEDSEKNNYNIINRLELIYLNISALEIERIFKSLNNDFNYFKKIFTELYKNKKEDLLEVLENEFFNSLACYYNENNKYYINFIINTISNTEFVNILKNSNLSFLFNLIVEYHYDFEFQKNIIDKNIPENLLYRCLDDSITYMGYEYLMDHSFNNVITQTIRDNINNNNLNILDIYKNYEIYEEIKDEVSELNKEFNNFFSILLYIYNKIDFENKKNIINIIEEQDFINYLKFCCINTDNYINFINNQKKEFNWKRKSPLLLVWYYSDKNKKRKLNEIKLTEMPPDMIREIISFI